MLEKSISTSDLDWVAPIKRSRKNRSVEEKRKIVLESLTSGASIAAVARNHNINPNLLHTWRWQYRRGELGERQATPSLIPVQIEARSTSCVKSTSATSELPEGHLEIIVGEVRVLVHGSVQSDVILSVLRAVVQ